MNVLKFGYPSDKGSLCYHCKELYFNDITLKPKVCSCKVSDQLNIELPNGASYCKCEDEVEQLSFVFAVSQGSAYSVNHERSISNLDSRGCAAASFGNCNDSFYRSIQGMVPVYLIVFNITK